MSRAEKVNSSRACNLVRSAHVFPVRDIAGAATLFPAAGEAGMVSLPCRRAAGGSTPSCFCYVHPSLAERAPRGENRRGAVQTGQAANVELMNRAEQARRKRSISSHPLRRDSGDGMQITAAIHQYRGALWPTISPTFPDFPADITSAKIAGLTAYGNSFICRRDSISRESPENVAISLP